MAEFNTIAAIDALIRTCETSRELAEIKREGLEREAANAHSFAAHWADEVVKIDAQIAGWEAAKDAVRAANREQFAAAITSSQRE
jgi:hypothetical protein